MIMKSVSKTHFMVINGTTDDRIKMELAPPSGDIVSKHCEKYTSSPRS